MADEELKQLVGLLKLVRSWPALVTLMAGLLGAPFVSTYASTYLSQGQAQTAKEVDVARPVHDTEDPVLKLLKEAKDERSATRDKIETIGKDVAAVKGDVSTLEGHVAENKADLLLVKKAYLESEEKKAAKKPRRRR